MLQMFHEMPIKAKDAFNAFQSQSEKIGTEGVGTFSRVSLKGLGPRLAPERVERGENTLKGSDKERR